MQYPRELKERVAQRLRVLPRGSQKIMAAQLEVTTRTLRSWKKEINFNKKSGPKKEPIKFMELLAVVREWKRQGYPGERPVRQALPGIRLRVIREVIGELKKRRQKRRERIINEVRTSMSVEQVGAVMSMDGASLSKGVDYLIYKDRGSLKVNAEKCELFLKSEDTLKVLEKLKNEDSLPLVLCTDNGSPLCSKNVEEFLNTNYIIHLKNLPHVPQHNGSCEIAVREFKEVFNETLNVESAIDALNYYRRRRTLNWQTSKRFEEMNFKKKTLEERIKFYENTKMKIESATIGIENAKEKRKKEREAIFQSMEDFSLIKITRGRQSRYVKAEENT